MLVGTPIEHLLLECGLARSGSEATRKVQQGAVRVNGEKFTTVRTPVDRDDSFLLQVGRQILRIVVVTPSDVFVTTIPSQSGDGVDHHAEQGAGRRRPSHARERACARARSRGVGAQPGVRVRERAARWRMAPPHDRRRSPCRWWYSRRVVDDRLWLPMSVASTAVCNLSHGVDTRAAETYIGWTERDPAGWPEMLLRSWAFFVADNSVALSESVPFRVVLPGGKYLPGSDRRREVRKKVLTRL